LVIVIQQTGHTYIAHGNARLSHSIAALRLLQTERALIRRHALFSETIAVLRIPQYPYTTGIARFRASVYH